MESLEFKKFKVGDRVKVINNSGNLYVTEDLLNAKGTVIVLGDSFVRPLALVLLDSQESELLFECASLEKLTPVKQGWLSV